MDKHKCDFCRESLIVSYNWIPKLITKHINAYKKGKNKDFQIETLKMFAKMCPYMESFLLFNEPEIYKLLEPFYFSNVLSEVSYFLRRSYLYERKDTIESDIIHCDFCLREACRFHVNYGGFIFGECNQSSCNRRYSICGWCQEKILDRFKSKCVYCCRFLLNNKQSFDEFKVSTSASNSNNETIDIKMPPC